MVEALAGGKKGGQSMTTATPMTGENVSRSLDRIAHEIVEQQGSPVDWALVGIVTGGQHLAQRLADRIESICGTRPQTGMVDITLYRDDLYTGLEKPVLGETRLPFALSGVGVILVDDVLFTGRTVRAAMDAIMDYGRPRFIKLAVLVDRGHRELPIAADFVGRVLPTVLADRVRVDLTEAGKSVDGVRVIPEGGQV
jgi:pyrimidine operon attenuation protein/uracil phosphoribosyltransferase